MALGINTKADEAKLKILGEELKKLKEKIQEEETRGIFNLGIDFPNFDRDNILAKETDKIIYIKLRGVTYKEWYRLYSKNKVLNSDIPEELRVKLGEIREEIDKRHGMSTGKDAEEIEMERIPSETDFLLQFSQDEINKIDSEIQIEQDKIIQLASDKKDEEERMGELKKQQDDLLTLVQQKGKLTEDVEKLRDEVGKIERRKEQIYEEHGTEIEMEGKINRLENQKRILTQTMKDKNVELKKVQKDTDSLKREIGKQQKLDKDIKDGQEKLNELKEKRLKLMRISNLENEKIQLEKVINDEGKSEEEKNEARERINEIEDELNELQTKLTLRERIKMIFKKYGLSVLTITLSVSAIISTITTILLKELKTVGKNVGNGLKEVGKKLANILPGLIGTIVSFIFKAAGEAISFLGKNAWLLITAVVIFLVERISNKR